MKNMVRLESLLIEAYCAPFFTAGQEVLLPYRDIVSLPRFFLGERTVCSALAGARQFVDVLWLNMFP